MNVGFDAKRAFHNDTGLGQYSRNLLVALSEFYPTHQYYLFNPKPSALFSVGGTNMHEILPGGIVNRLFRSAWRSHRVIMDLSRLRIDLYHGLSHEIPLGIHKTSIRSVVTIHDLLPERYPQQYNPIDVKIYRKKSSYACANAHRVITVSKQTKRDIMAFYKTTEEKITVCYQCCSPAFGMVVSEPEKKRVQLKYGLPAEFFLHVGSVVERKNLLNICKALFLLRHDLNIPLVVIGNGKKYKQQVKEFIRQNGLEQKIIFLSEKRLNETASSFLPDADLPAIYQSAVALIYPSFFEGFGIPVLEALWSRLPVITSNVSSLPEAGGEAAYYIDPSSTGEISEAMKKIYSDKQLSASMAEKGWVHAQNFTAQKSANGVIRVYENLWQFYLIILLMSCF